MRVTLAPGVGATSGRRLVGTLLDSDSNGLTLCLGQGVPITLPAERVLGLELSHGRHARRRNALIGAGVGALTALAATFAWYSSSNDDEAPIGLAFGLFLYTPLAAGVGAGIGLVVPPGERWARGEAPPSRPGIGVSLRF